MTSQRAPISARIALHRALEHWAHIADRRSSWLAALLIACLFAYGLAQAHAQPFWLDEIMGLLIAKLPSVSAIWEICKGGADNQPVFFHLLTRSTVRLLGNDQLGLRLPALLGYMLLCWSLYRFVSRLSSGLYGVIAILFAGLSGSWFYATDGRPYGLFLGFTGLAAVCWQALGSSRHRTLALVGLALSLTLLFNTHYYAPLVLGPLALAEIVRTRVERKFHGAVWFAFVLPLLALLPYLPVIREARLKSGVAGDYLSSPAWYGSLRFVASELLTPFLVPLIAIACLFLLYEALSRPDRAGGGPSLQTRTEQNSSWPAQLLPDLTLIISFACSPVLVVMFSKFATHVFFTRYAMMSAFGVEALLAVCLWFAFAGRQAPAILSAIVLVLPLIYTNAQRFASFRSPAEVRLEMQSRVPAEAVAGNLPIAVEDPHTYMEMYYYTDAIIRQRLVYLTDEQYALHVMNSTFLERMMIGSAPFFGTQVVNYKQFIASHSDFFVMGGLDWCLGKHLLEDKAQITLRQGGLVDNQGTHAEVLLRVHMPAMQSH